MSRSEGDISGTAETLAVIFKVIQRANLPLTLASIHRSLPGPFRVDRTELAGILEDQAHRGIIHSWPPWRGLKRYWTRNPEDFGREKMLEILSDRPLPAHELEAALSRALFHCSLARAKELRKRILKGLMEEKRAFEHPPVGRQRKTRFAIHPPDPSPYLARLKKEFDAACRILKQAGYTPHEVFQAAGDLLVPSWQRAEAQVAASEDVGRTILHKILEIEPAANRQALVSIRELRGAMSLAKEAFDRGVLDLAGQGRIFLHRHVYPAGLDAKEREEMVSDDQGNYYMGIVLRS